MKDGHINLVKGTDLKGQIKVKSIFLTGILFLGITIDEKKLRRKKNANSVSKKYARSN